MATSTGQSFDWAGHTARMIASIGRDDLTMNVLAALRELVAFEHTGVFLFRSGRRPRDLLARRYGGVYHRTYCGDTYRLDPFYKGAQRSQVGGLYRMPELDPDYRQYLDRYEMGPRLVDLLPARGPAIPGGGGLAEEIGFLLPIGAGRVVHIALIRSTALGAFEEREIGPLRTVAPVLQAAFESHFSRYSSTALAARDDEAELRRQALWRAGRLTAREIEIVENMLLGLATEQIAARLAIAAGTVKVHRKSIYRKLAVSSRDELLSLCLAV